MLLISQTNQMQMNHTTKQEKLAFLKTSIEKQDVLEHVLLQRMAALKPHWDNLDNWTMLELQDIVARHPPTDFATELIIINDGDEVLPEQDVTYPNKMKDMIFQEEMECERIEPVFCADQRITVMGVSCKKETSYFFLTKNQLYYELRLQLQDVCFQRRESDILWLKNKLAKLCPWAFLSPLQLGEETQLAIKNMQHFLHELCHQPTVLHHRLVARFFDPMCKIQDLKQQLQKHPELLKDVTLKATEDGKQNVRIGSYYNDYYKTIKKHLSGESLLLAQLDMTFRELSQAFVQVGCKIDRLKQIFYKMESAELQFRCNSGVGRNRSFQTVYQEAQHLLQNWSTTYKDRSRFYQNSMVEFICRRRSDLKAILEVCQRRADAQNVYLSSRGKCESSPVQGQKEGRELVDKLRRWLGMMNVSCEESITKRQDRAAKDFKRSMSKLCLMHSNQLQTEKKVLAIEIEA